MPPDQTQLAQLIEQGALRTARPQPSEAPGVGPIPAWSRRALAGRLVELSGEGDGAALTLAASLVLDAQREGETVAWIQRTTSSFFPPDLERRGVDLHALAVVRVPDARAVARAADRLARSGAFGLLVLDLGADPVLPTPLLSRLLGLALHHDLAVLCLTHKHPDRPSLDSLISLRAACSRRRLPPTPGAAEARFVAGLRVLKDKRRAPDWTHMEECLGPPGLR